MPFIVQDLREKLDNSPWFADKPGELCYLYYKEMVDRWRANPRWTTAHEIFRNMIDDTPEDKDKFAASRLAWQVFFQLYVMPYELKKREENGDI